MKEKIKTILLADIPYFFLGLIAFGFLSIGLIISIYLSMIWIANDWPMFLACLIAALIGIIPYTLVLVWLLYRRKNGKIH